MFNRTKSKEAKRTRLIYKIIQGSPSITKALAKLRRNFPDELEGEK